jgi:hypothetical protein
MPFSVPPEGIGAVDAAIAAAVDEPCSEVGEDEEGGELDEL